MRTAKKYNVKLKRIAPIQEVIDKCLAAGLSQADLSRLSGLSQQALVNLRKNPNADTHYVPGRRLEHVLADIRAGKEIVAK